MLSLMHWHVVFLHNGADAVAVLSAATMRFSFAAHGSVHT